jgi:hypothetical protein
MFGRMSGLDQIVIAPPGSPEYWPTAAQQYQGVTQGGVYLYPMQQVAYNEIDNGSELQAIDSSEFPDTPIPGFNGLGHLGQIVPQVSDATKSAVVYGAIAVIGLAALFWFARRKG